MEAHEHRPCFARPASLSGNPGPIRGAPIRTFQLTCKRYPKSGRPGRLQNEYNINVTLGGTEEE